MWPCVWPSAIGFSTLLFIFHHQNHGATAKTAPLPISHLQRYVGLRAWCLLVAPLPLCPSAHIFLLYMALCLAMRYGSHHQIISDTVRLGDPDSARHFGTQNSCLSMSIKILMPELHNHHHSLCSFDIYFHETSIDKSSVFRSAENPTANHAGGYLG